MNLYIYGASGHAKVVGELAELEGYNIVSAFDKNLLIKTLLDQYPVAISTSEYVFDIKGPFVVAIGNNALRKRIVENELQNHSFVKLVHPHANVSKYAEVEEGTVVMAGVSINADVQIGRHCIINTNASVDHDCVIEDYVHISPNASLAGNVLIGEGSQIGIGACVIQGINIGKNCIIGAGTVIIKDVPNGSTVVGNPGRIIKSNI